MNKLDAVGLLAVGVSALSDPPNVDGNTQVNDKDLIAYYNSRNGASWIAGYNDFFAGMSFNDARATLGAQLSHISEHLNETLPDSVYEAVDAVPAQFDARTKWHGLIHPIRISSIAVVVGLFLQLRFSATVWPSPGASHLRRYPLRTWSAAIEVTTAAGEACSQMLGDI
mgnify:CR=1 FL=1